MKLPSLEISATWRDLPRVTLGVALVWVLLAAGVELGFSGSLREADQGLRTAARFALDHPEVHVSPRVLPVARALMPSFESNEAFDFLRRKAAVAGGTQDQFDGLSAEAFDKLVPGERVEVKVRRLKRHLRVEE